MNKMKYLTIVTTAIILCSCNNQTNKKEENKTAKPVTTSCYIYAFHQDTVMLQLKDSNSVFTGTLNYLPYEKDGTIGSLYNIKTSGDTLFAMYQSTQEGQESFCEMAMLKKDNSYILTNDIWSNTNYKYDSSYTYGKFIDKNKISFNGDTLKVANCN
jgi:hypothetical protein